MRTIAFYLPQFHPIAENDAWWGKGFTDWTNVAKARPLFRGHYQPHLPADLGFYDLRLPEVREAQAEMAAACGITGFCYFHYWFNGKRLLNRPFDEVLASRSPTFPFCLCWANENWTRRWDGRDDMILIGQNHSPEDDNRHIEHLIRAFGDDRYIKINGRPLFLVYRTGWVPNVEYTAELWRKACHHAGFQGLYLARVESHGDCTPPERVGFDAAVEFAPDFGGLPRPLGQWPVVTTVQYWLSRSGVPASPFLANRVQLYESALEAVLAKPPVAYKRFRCATPGWDNSPRRAAYDVAGPLFKGAHVLHESTPAGYERWLRHAARETRERRQGDEQILFVNAWNEWAEGNHLEPDLRWGHAYLEATARVLNVSQADR
jgi:lipopolysaccharide biosynthesis protein